MSDILLSVEIENKLGDIELSSLPANLKKTIVYSFRVLSFLEIGKAGLPSKCILTNVWDISILS